MIAHTEETELPQELLTAASDWFIRLREEGVSEADTSAWLDWCTEDPRHLDAFERVRDLFDELRSLDVSKRQSFVDHAIAPTTTGSRGPVFLRLGLGVLVASLLAAAFALYVTPRAPTQEFATPRGALRQITLSDLSTVTLGAESTLSSRYSDSVRHLVLEGGQAFFRVKPNRTRPFVVDAGGVRVTAVGTQFDVRRTQERTIVTVTEGIVDVAPEGASVPLRVQAGQRAVQEADTRRVTIAAIDPQTAQSWQRGRLEYTSEPLGSVVEDVNRYTARPIILADESIRHLVYTGTVFQDRAQEWARALDSVFPVSSTTRADGSVVLTARANPRPGS